MSSSFEYSVRNSAGVLFFEKGLKNEIVCSSH